MNIFNCKFVRKIIRVIRVRAIGKRLSGSILVTPTHERQLVAAFEDLKDRMESDTKQSSVRLSPY
eukprot:maker-scaffold_4-snap-gene-14.0-mRNA-1 protein AED:0.45 eAED:0.66 QI:10/0/0.5/1/0/0/2/0/64